MLPTLHSRKGVQLALGLVFGIVFGFLLQKGAATRYDVIIGQLLLQDFTVVKIMLSAVITGMVGVHLLEGLGMAKLHVKGGSLGQSAIGGLIFGVGFGILGYCPGTIAGAAGNGALDALVGGVPGIIIGAGIFAALYPRLRKTILNKGDFGELTLPQLLRVPRWALVIVLAIGLTALLWGIEKAGL